MVDNVTAYEVLWQMAGAQLEGRPLALPVADDCLFVLPGISVRGFDKARRYFAALLNVYPDTVKRVHHLLRDDRTVAIRSTVTGHNTGVLATSQDVAQPTGREVEWDIVEWLVVKGGVIVEWRIYQEATPYIDALNAQRAAAQGITPANSACPRNVVFTAPTVSARLDTPLADEPTPAARPGNDD